MADMGARRYSSRPLPEGRPPRGSWPPQRRRAPKGLHSSQYRHLVNTALTLQSTPVGLRRGTPRKRATSDRRFQRVTFRGRRFLKVAAFFVLRPRRRMLPRTWPQVSPSALPIWAVDRPWSASVAPSRSSSARSASANPAARSGSTPCSPSRGGAGRCRARSRATRCDRICNYGNYGDSAFNCRDCGDPRRTTGHGPLAGAIVAGQSRYGSARPRTEAAVQLEPPPHAHDALSALSP